MKPFFFFILFISASIANGQLKLAKIFSDHMVLQRNQPICIWGTGKPEQIITVVFGKEKQTATVQKDSSWKLYLMQRNASAIPVTLSISCNKEQVLLKDILIGDVWLCIGQSNMEWAMNKELHYQEELPQTNQPLLRFYNPLFAGKYAVSEPFTDSIARRLNKDDFYNGQWEISDSSTIGPMSAVAYYFAKDIIREINVPVGLIHLAIGGSPIEAWINKKLLLGNKQFAKKISGNWISNDNLPVWVRQRGNENVGQSAVVFKDETGPNHAFKPGFAYEAGIAGIIAQPIKGILCYQGESNAQELSRVNEYGALFKLMVNDYRQKWKQPAMPVYWVQLSSIDTVKYKGQLWPEFRNEQRKLLDEITNSGMVVCTDIGTKDNVHPTNKKTVGERLARWALNKTYKKNITASGPLPKQAIQQKGKIIVNFTYAGKSLATMDGATVRGFSVDGDTTVKAVITGNRVVIAYNKKAASVEYGWRSFTNANLCNQEKLPASTFKIKKSSDLF